MTFDVNPPANSWNRLLRLPRVNSGVVQLIEVQLTEQLLILHAMLDDSERESRAARERDGAFQTLYGELPDQNHAGHVTSPVT